MCFVGRTDFKVVIKLHVQKFIFSLKIGISHLFPVSRILFLHLIVVSTLPGEERIFTAAFGESFKREHAAELVGRDLSEPQSNASQTSSKEKMKLRDSIVARSLAHPDDVANGIRSRRRRAGGSRDRL